MLLHIAEAFIRKDIVAIHLGDQVQSFAPETELKLVASSDTKDSQASLRVVFPVVHFLQYYVFLPVRI